MKKTEQKIREISSEIILNQQEATDYYRFGAEYFGLFLYGYTHWLYSSIQKENYSKIFFLSRDGYMMKKAFDIFDNIGVSCDYVYFSRNSIRQALLNKCVDYAGSLQYLSCERYVSFGKILEYYGFSEKQRNQISEEYGIDLKKDFKFSELKTNKEMERVYYELKPFIDEHSICQEKMLERYLKQIGMMGQCAIVDIGWHGNMQFYLEHFAQIKNIDVTFSGYYVGINPISNVKGRTFGYLFDKNDLRLRKSVLCFLGAYEKLFQSCEGSTFEYVDVNENIVPKLTDYEYKNDVDLIQHIQEWQNGALQFVENAYQKGFTVLDDRALAVPLIKVGKNPTIKQVKMFEFLYNVDGTKAYYVCQKPLYQYRLKDFLHDFSNSVWKTGFMKSAFKLPLPYYLIYAMIRK